MKKKIFGGALLAVLTVGCAQTPTVANKPEAAKQSIDVLVADRYETVTMVDTGWQTPAKLSIAREGMEVNRGEAGDESKAFAMTTFMVSGERPTDFKIFKLAVMRKDCVSGVGTAVSKQVKSYGLGPAELNKFNRTEKTLISLAADTLCKRAWP
jgi:PBP1b-binding outer membrane lipoprotein LpoB